MTQLHSLKELSDKSSLPIQSLNFSPKEENLLERMRNIPNDLTLCNLDAFNKISNASYPTPPSTTTEKVANTGRQTLFPNVAMTMLQVGLRVENQHNKTLERHAAEAQEIQKTIEQLIDLSNMFGEKARGNKETELSEKIQKLSSDLEKKGIDLFKEDPKKLKEEQIIELKAKIGAHTDRLKTDLQIKFTTEIQVKINELQSILDCLKTIEKYASRLNETIIANQRGGH